MASRYSFSFQDLFLYLAVSHYEILAGCAKYIQEHCDVSSVPIFGASAGSLSAALLLNNCDFDRAVDVAFEIACRYKIYESGGGFKGMLGPMLSEWLEEVLPEAMDPKTFSNLNIALTPADYNIPKNPKLVSCFESRSELLECLLASCHIPLLLDGRPKTTYKKKAVIDGSFWFV